MAEDKPIYITRQDLATFASVLVERSRLAASLGKQFDGDRDLYKVLGYPKAIDFNAYLGAYKRGGIAKLIINRPAADTWRTQAALHDGDAIDGTDFLKQWQTLVKKRRVWSALAQVDRLAGIGRFGVLLFGFAGEGKLKDPVQPGSLAGPQSLLYLRAFHEGDVTVERLDEKANSERFGLPETYSIRVSDHGTERVHWSRVLHVAEDSTDDVYGVPRLEAVYNYLEDLVKIIGGGAEATWKLMRKGFGLDVKPEYDMPADVEDDMQEQIEEMEHGLRRFMLTRGVTPFDLGSEVVDPTGLFNALIALIAGTTGIPQRRMLGSERGELASSQDEANWASIIEARREHFAEPGILRPFIDRLIWTGVLPAPASGEYSVKWETLFTLTEGEEAKIAGDYTAALQRLLDSGFTPEDALAFLIAMPDPATFKLSGSVAPMTAERARRGEGETQGRRDGETERRRDGRRYWRLHENEKRTARAVAQEVTAAAAMLADVLDGEQAHGD